MTQANSLTYQFGEFILDITGYKLMYNGKPVPLTPKAFDTLVMLVQMRGHLVEKEELIRKLWPDTYVGDTALAQNIFTLRKALGEGTRTRKYIETVPKRGYRFVASVIEKRGLEAASTETGGAAPASTKADGGSSGSLTISLAVLPLVNASNDPQLEHIADSMTDTLTYRFSQLAHLRVMARSTVSKYKGGEVDPLQVGRELAVQAVFVGKVNQVGDRLIISVELVDVARGWQLWGEQYSRMFPDIFDVQDEIARSVSERLRLKLSKEGRTGEYP
jgi:TolB-like protein